MTLRTPTSIEQNLLDRLLSVDVQGKNEMKLQSRNILVESIDTNGSIRIHVVSDILAPVARRIPVEAQCQDSDGIWIHALLHVIDGKLSELEIYKDDSSSVQVFPKTNEWQLMVL